MIAKLIAMHFYLTWLIWRGQVHARRIEKARNKQARIIAKLERFRAFWERERRKAAIEN